MRRSLYLATLVLTLVPYGQSWSQELVGQGPLQRLSHDSLHSFFPSTIHLMLEASAVENFLAELDVEPPDWKTIYGHGHHDPGMDDRLFALNRERDAKREGRSALGWRVAFAWSGELSSYDPHSEGFPVAVGPKFIKTKWGMVRFKPEEVPGNLSVSTGHRQRDELQKKLENGQSVAIDVVMTGKPIPEESIVYDFSHDEDGLGLIMPFIRVERVDFIMAP